MKKSGTTLKHQSINIAGFMFLLMVYGCDMNAQTKDQIDTDPTVGKECFSTDLVGSWTIEEIVPINDQIHLDIGDEVRVVVTGDGTLPTVRRFESGVAKRWGRDWTGLCRPTDNSRYMVKGTLTVDKCEHTVLITRESNVPRDARLPAKLDMKKITVNFVKSDEVSPDCEKHGHGGETHPGSAHGYH